MRVVLKPGGIAFIVILAIVGILAVVSFIRTGKKTSHPVPLMVNSDHLIDPEKTFNDTVLKNASDASITDETATDPPTGVTRVAHIVIKKKPKDPWDVMITKDIATVTTNNQAVTLSFWGRSPEACTVHAVVEENAEPFPKSLDKEIILTPVWQRYTFQFTVPAYPAGTARAGFHLGYKVGTIELAGIQLQNGNK